MGVLMLKAERDKSSDLSHGKKVDHQSSISYCFLTVPVFVDFEIRLRKFQFFELNFEIH